MRGEGQPLLQILINFIDFIRHPNLLSLDSFKSPLSLLAFLPPLPRPLALAFATSTPLLLPSPLRLLFLVSASLDFWMEFFTSRQ